MLWVQRQAMWQPRTLVLGSWLDQPFFGAVEGRWRLDCRRRRFRGPLVRGGTRGRRGEMKLCVCGRVLHTELAQSAPGSHTGGDRNPLQGSRRMLSRERVSRGRFDCPRPLRRSRVPPTCLAGIILRRISPSETTVSVNPPTQELHAVPESANLVTFSAHPPMHCHAERPRVPRLSCCAG